MKNFVILCTLLMVVAAFPDKKFDGDKVNEDGILFKEFKPKPSIEGRISNGKEALPHQFPYQAGLQLRFAFTFGLPQNLTTHCGGALISKTVVLTAAFCLVYTEEATVYLGTRFIDTKTEGQIISTYAKDFIIHPGYSEATSMNDIALIILPEAAELNDYVQLAYLHNPKNPLDGDGNSGELAGWGWTGGFIADETSTLHWDNFVIIPDSPCEHYYPNKFHSSTQLCAASENGVSPCPGDYGDPLIIYVGQDTKFIYGLVSFGMQEGCQRRYPTVFTKVTPYLDWIKQHTGIQ